MHRRDAPEILEWIRSQAEGGATIVAICSGALVVAEAGLLDGRSATTHWFDVNRLVRRFPTVTRVVDRRYVADRGVVTTTGVTASVPVSLALVEAIAGREQAARVAGEIGAPSDWAAEHDSDAYGLDAKTILSAAGRRLAFWRHEKVGFEVAPGVDEIGLAFAADAYSRTYRSRAFAIADSEEPIRTLRGLSLLPDQSRGDARVAQSVSLDLGDRPVGALERALDGIAAHYGEPASAFVALQLESPRPSQGGD